MGLQTRQPLFSIIIPVYNSAKYLKQCFDSILNQSFKDVEVICINDCSKDNSEKIIHEYSINCSNIKLINNSHNLGTGISRNIGLENADGKYVLFLDSDDWLTDNSLEKLANIVNKHPNTEVVSYIYYDYDEKSGKTALLQNIPKDYLNKDINAYVMPNCINYLGYGMQKLFLKDFLVNNNIYFNSYLCSEDQEHLIDVVKNAKSIIFTNEVIFYYRHHKKSRSECTYLHLEYFRNQIKTIHNSFKENYPEISETLLKKIYPHFFQSLIKSYGSFHITFNELKKIMLEDFELDIIKQNPDCYYSKIYNRIFEQNKSELYFRMLFSSKVYLSIVWQVYKIFKKLYN